MSEDGRSKKAKTSHHGGLPERGAKLEKPPMTEKEEVARDLKEAGYEEWDGIKDEGDDGDENSENGGEQEVSEDEDDSQSDGSLMDDLLGLEHDGQGENSDSFTSEEAALIRKALHSLGPEAFVEKYIDSNLYSIHKLLTAFGVHVPEGLVDEETSIGLLSMAFRRELHKRQKLEDVNTVDDVVNLILKSSNIMVITGAGISTSLGIPDFRSKGTGLYAKLEHLGLDDPQEVFDIHVFKEDPTIFYSIAKDIIPEGEKFTPTHKFIAMLSDKGKLLTNYSQNIDNLEVKAGVPREKLIQCHGSFGGARCMSCGWTCEGERVFPEIREGKVPRCEACVERLEGERKRKRVAAAAAGGGGDGKQKKKKKGGSEDEEDDDGDGYDIPEPGVMKPTITFFGEDLPDDFHHRLEHHDREKVDMVIVIGTSLKVSPVSEISNFLPRHVPQVYISREPVRHINFDVELLGDCDLVVEELCSRLGEGWEGEMGAHEMCWGGGVRVEGVEGESRWVFGKEGDDEDEKGEGEEEDQL